MNKYLMENLLWKKIKQKLCSEKNLNKIKNVENVADTVVSPQWVSKHIYTDSPNAQREQES